MRSISVDFGKLKNCFSVVIPIALIYCVFSITGIGCPIRFLTGVSCAGCGMTRATAAFFEGNYRAAFYYHPLFFMPYIALILYVLRNNFSKRVRKTMLIGIVVLFLAVYLYRLIFTDQNIVVFDPKSGFIYRAARFIYDLITDLSTN